jgi:hypothetical protein
MVNQNASGFKLLFLMLALMSICACGERSESRYKGTLVDDGRNKYCVKPGNNEVFEMREFKSAGIIPFAYSGYSLMFEIDPALVRVGQTFQIPSDEIKAKFYGLGHNSRAIDDFSGKLTIISTSEDFVVADIDLTIAGEHWGRSGKVTFENSESRPCYTDSPPGPIRTSSREMESSSNEKGNQ